MRSLLFTFALLLAAASPGIASPYPKSALGDLVQLAATTCTAAGQMICGDDCTQVILCVSNGQGGFENVIMETCGDGTRCSAELGACVAGSTACVANPGSTIDCHEPGVFPDPYNCTVYHICLSENTVSFPNSCPEGHAYNALTADCSSQMTDPVCEEGPVPICKYVGQTGSLASNPSIYYICTTIENALVPQLYKCMYGLVYDPSVPGCVESSSTRPPTDSSPATSPTHSPPTDSTAGPPTPGGPCPIPLVIVADPEDCRRYYECSPKYRWLHVSCTVGFYFNPVHNRCELGWCDNLKL